MESDALVRRVNEVYHDVEGQAYQQLHPEIFQEEARRWQELAREYLGGGSSKTILDFGCGTGFVGMQLAGVLGAGDRLVCGDVSGVMLEVARGNLSELRCPVEFVRLEDTRLPFPRGHFDVVTVNAALHHVPDLPALLGEIDRVLRPGGRLIVCHEPSKPYFARGLPRRVAQVAAVVFSPRQAMGGALRRLGVIDVARRFLRPFSRRDALYDRTLEQVNRILLAEGSIQRPLTQDQLTALVDVHSPTAGGFRPGRGIDLPQLARESLPNFVIERFETHNHLGDHLSSKNRLTRRINAHLSRRYPHHGATLLAVLRK